MDQKGEGIIFLYLHRIFLRKKCLKVKDGRIRILKSLQHMNYPGEDDLVGVIEKK